jgi:hypothetical protein
MIRSLLITVLFQMTWACAVTPSYGAQALGEAIEVSVPKLALVIGNRDYASYPAVDAAANDAALIAARLHALGFDVVVRTNLTYDGIITEIKDLKRRSEQSASNDVRPLAVVFFSGHGFVLSERQFIAGVDAGKAVPKDPAYESPALQYIADQLGEATSLIGFMDACRSDLAQQTSRGVNTELREDQESNAEAPTPGLGSFRRAANSKHREYLFAFANKSGEPVRGATKKETNSPYTRALSHVLGSEDNIFGQLHSVREEMLQSVPGFDPNFTDFLTRDVFLNYSEGVLARLRRDWSEAARTPTDEIMRNFIRHYGNGPLTYRALQWLRHTDTAY